MRIYAISGLGADERVYSELALNYELIHIKWIRPSKNESLDKYAIRLCESINQNEPFGIIGLSFGGMIATEIAKVLKPKFTILISSAETKYELRRIYRIFGFLNLVRFFPLFCFDMPRRIAYFIFGAKNKPLLKEILDDADLLFTKWAVIQISGWKNTTTIKNAYKISGTSDKLLPPNKQSNITLIDKGEHFMIVDRADELSEILNQKISVHL
jgi:hypothetical protein